MEKILEILLRSVEAADREALRQAFTVLEARIQGLEILLSIFSGIFAGIITALVAVVWKLHKQVKQLSEMAGMSGSPKREPVETTV